MKILVFADLHYYGGDINSFNSEKKLVQYAIPMLDKLIEAAEDENVSLAVNLGDIIQDTRDKEKDMQYLRYMFGYLKKFTCPCYSLLGNHDLKMMDSAEEVRKIMGYETLRFSIDAGGFHLVFLTTDVFPELGTGRGGSFKTQTLSEEGLKWLESDLENNSLPAIIFTHFPLAERVDVQDECAYLKNRAEVKKIIKNKNVKAVFSGHQHTPGVFEEDGIKHFVVGSPTTSLEADGIPIGVYRIIETKSDSIEVSEHNIVLNN